MWSQVERAIRFILLRLIHFLCLFASSNSLVWQAFIPVCYFLHTLMLNTIHTPLTLREKRGE